jgi:hypothetical protein
MSSPLPDTPTVGLGQYITIGRFVVPTHQRDYSWTNDYVTEFLRDIEEAMKRESSIYFCGLMVFTKTPSAVLKVLDGQQRLATTIMIFSAIRNWFHKYSEFSKFEHQIEDYLGNSDLGSDKVQPRLSLTPANNDAFQKFVIAAVPAADIAKAIRNNSEGERSKTLLKAALLINKQIEARADQLGTKEAAKDYFINLGNFLTTTVRIVSFVVNDDAAAYTIFETLNDRGLDLAALDLVKNYLFSRAERYRAGGLAELEGRWAEMVALLGSARADTFLRAFWASRHGKMEGAQLFTAFKKAYEKPADTYTVSIEMRAGAERYAALFNSNDSIWSGFSTKARRSVDAISLIGLSQAHPIVLAAFDKNLARNEMERLLWLLEVIAVRYQLVRRGRPGRVESLGGRAAREIFEGKITTATQVLNVVDELNIPDAEFKGLFATKTEKDGDKARYLITGIERQSLLRTAEALADELVPGNVTLEHILPKSPNDHWSKEINNDPHLAREMTNRLGNLCLLPGINQKLGNKSWDEKKAVFAQSRLHTTNKLTQYDKWGRAEIEQRQSYMAELAVQAWRFQ